MKICSALALLGYWFGDTKCLLLAPRSCNSREFYNQALALNFNTHGVKMSPNVFIHGSVINVQTSTVESPSYIQEICRTRKRQLVVWG